jgi:hypothetical protein
MPAKVNRAPRVAWIQRRALEYTRTMARVENATAYTQWMITDRIEVPATIVKPRTAWPRRVRTDPASARASISWAKAAERNDLYASHRR